MARAAVDLIPAAWPAPTGVRAGATTRTGGVSAGVFASLNLGDHVHDDASAVDQNRALLRHALKLPGDPVWLTQVHGNAVVTLKGTIADSAPRRIADAAITRTAGVVCAVLTADCLPVLFCNRAGTHVAAAHAGWRGLASGVLEATVAALDAAGAPADSLLAWLGPAIGPASYEVGAEVRDAFLRADPSAEVAFEEHRPGHWLLDLYAAARARLHRAGVTAVTGGEYCTLSDRDRFYSYRRDGVTGRQAALIWLERS